ncbi:hypothetical protein ACFOY4_00060 [Actinomadura syzygii]|uniref:Uncharacterized protein n=1 Tax=Actinomadura syzygii TaxID=1427538 RepID=A0A5D0TQM5_9ACTN|nr:hypothetical protein [Actinomadura syzygii]TYC08114.1 hypothetical protein FXF65_40345 [Actinomadura syzygii]
MDIDWGDAPAWVAIAVSLMFSIAAFVVSIKGLTWQRMAAEAAVTSANADEQALALAQLQHELEQARSERSERLSEPPKVEWRLERRGKQKFVLRNVGTEMATGVTMDRSNLPYIAHEAPSGVAVRVGGSHEFLLAGTMGHPMPNEVWLSWDGQEEPVALPIPGY